MYEALNFAKLDHGAGLKCVDPLAAAAQHIMGVGDNTLSSLEKPVIGLHLRRGDRLYKKLNHSMSQ